MDYQKNGNTVTPDNTTAGIYDIVPSGATASDNYTVIYLKGMLNIREGLVLPAFLTLIEESAFEGIDAQRVYISENVVSIEKRAFADCKDLREIFIPATVQSIDDTALAGCVNVTVYGTAGSEAQRFAIAAGFDFVDPNGAE